MNTAAYFMFSITFIFTFGLVFAEDLPCIARMMEAGYVCVCNETYCDTVERPIPLDRGLYYHYKTSKNSPGFNKTIGLFLNTTGSKWTFDASSSDAYILVNSTIQYQTFEGIGASFTDNAGIAFKTLPLGAQQKLIETHFGITGSEYAFARVPISGSDFSPRLYTYDDVPDDVDLKFFNLTKEDFTLKIPMIKQAMSISKRGLKLIGSMWSAPPWMKTNNSSMPGFIHFKYLDVLAKYHLKFLEAYSLEGINIWGLTTGNEANVALYFGSLVTFPLPTNIFLPQQARYWIKKYMGPMLEDSDFKNVKIIGLDDERPFLSWYSHRMLADKEASKYISGFGIHWYMDYDESVPELDELHNNHPDKFLLYTESSINPVISSGPVVNLGDWTRGVRYMDSLFTSFTHWVVGYIDWNIDIDVNGAPCGTHGYCIEASTVINSTSGEFYKQPLFYALAHFSKFISPGSKRIHTAISQDSVEIYEDREYNIFDELSTLKPTPPSFPTARPIPLISVVTTLATTNPDDSHTVIVHNPTPEPVKLTIVDKTVGVIIQTLDPHSLNTFVYW